MGLYVDPGSNAARQAEEWKDSDPEGARLMRGLARYPLARWIGDWEKDPRRTVDDLITIGGDRLRTLVVYAIPHRDCGDLSAGGFGSPAEYLDFVGEVAAGINGRECLLILEPDGLTVTDCLSQGQLAERHSTMAKARNLLSQAGAKVYVDCGDSDWRSVKDTAAALQGVGAENFALNVAHFEPLENEHAFAKEIRKIVGAKVHYVVDTGRCGTGPHGDGRNRWCNPPLVGCGRRPTLTPKVRGCDALLWVKQPGSSDGAEFGGPEAGKWWPEFARRLAAAAHPPIKG